VARETSKQRDAAKREHLIVRLEALARRIGPVLAKLDARSGASLLVVETLAVIASVEAAHAQGRIEGDRRDVALRAQGPAR
jgi:hypothetical protein